MMKGKASYPRGLLSLMCSLPPPPTTTTTTGKVIRTPTPTRVEQHAESITLVVYYDYYHVNDVYYYDYHHYHYHVSVDFVVVKVVILDDDSLVFILLSTIHSISSFIIMRISIFFEMIIYILSNKEG